MLKQLRIMSAKRFTPRGLMIVLLSLGLVGGGCATTHSQSAQYKPHKPQMITASGPEEVGENPFVYKFNSGFGLSNEVTDNYPFFIASLLLQALPGIGSWKP